MLIELRAAQMSGDEKVHQEVIERFRGLYPNDAAIDLLSMDYFNRSEPGIYRPIVDALLGSDHYLHLADFDAYRRTHLAVDQTYGDRRKWMKMAVENIARGGKFSSDRTILDYARDIWKVVPVTVPGPSNV